MKQQQSGQYDTTLCSVHYIKFTIQVIVVEVTPPLVVKCFLEFIHLTVTCSCRSWTSSVTVQSPAAIWEFTVNSASVNKVSANKKLFRQKISVSKKKSSFLHKLRRRLFLIRFCWVAWSSRSSSSWRNVI